MTSVRLMIADDHEIVRQGLRAVLETHPNWEVVGEAATGRQAVGAAQQLRPDILIMDISMPELNGLEATQQVLKNNPRTQILVLSLHENEQLIRQVLAAGARGYVLKSDASRDLITAVEALSQGKSFFTSKVSDVVIDGFLRASVPPPDGGCLADRLTAREREIAQLLAEGKSNKEVAASLQISVKTVETHRSRIMTKLNLASIGDLVRYAIRNKMIDS